MEARDAKLAAARARHGKPFVTDVPIRRVAPKSAFLRRLERAQQAERDSRAPVLALRRSAK
jgi:hypothetical protein